MFSVEYAFGGTSCISGSGEGNIFEWKGGSASKAIKAHTGKVQVLYWNDKAKLLYSAGMDGKIISWNQTSGSLTKLAEVVSLDKFMNKFIPPGVVAMDFDSSNNKILIGTVGAQIYEYDQKAKRSSLVNQSHFGDELWGLCTCPDPNKSERIITCGSDNTVRMWDINKKEVMTITQPFQNDVRAVDWSSDGTFVVVGDMTGVIFLLDGVKLTVLDKAATKFSKMKAR